jgi:hypothetical protein
MNDWRDHEGRSASAAGRRAKDQREGAQPPRLFRIFDVVRFDIVWLDKA